MAGSDVEQYDSLVGREVAVLSEQHLAAADLEWVAIRALDKAERSQAIDADPYPLPADSGYSPRSVHLAV